MRNTGMRYNMAAILRRIYCNAALLTLVLSFCVTYAYGGYYSYPFTGKWNPSESPIVIGEHDYQDISNMRRKGNSLVSVGGQTYINSSAFDSTYYYPNSIFHYRKASPAESYVVIHGSSSEDGATGRWEATSMTIPNQAEFNGSVSHSDASGAINPMFAQGPDGMLIYCNSKETKVWGGDESQILSFITEDATPNYTEWIYVVRDQISGDASSAYIDGDYGRTYYVGSPYILNGVKHYIQEANTYTSTTAVYYWSGTAWASVAGLADGTSSGGKSLAVTGSMTWTTPASVIRYFYDYAMHWYKFVLSAGSAKVYFATGAVPIQDMANIWDGAYIPIAEAFTLVGSTPEDFTIYAQSNDELTVWPWDGNSTGGDIIFGFSQKVMGIYTRVAPGKENTNSATGTIKAYTGSGLVTLSAQGNLITDPPVDSSGVTFWDLQYADLESKTNIWYGSTEVETPPVYMYRYYDSAALDAEVEIYYAAGIPVPDDMKDYAIPIVFKNRLFLLNEIDGHQNKGMYSSYGTSYIFNGDDSNIIEFGDKEAITGAGVIFNVFQGEGYEQLVVMKTNETYRVIELPTGPFDVQKLSDVVGCVSPRSVASCSITNSGSEDARRQVLVWVSSSGVMASDGGAVWSISDDIKMYWDEQDSNYVSPADLALSRGFYDPNLNVYKLLVDDLELEYSFTYNQWTKLSRVDSATATPYQLEAGCVVRDTSGRAYVYGASTDGIVYRTENGHYWGFSGGASGIDGYVKTKSMMVDEERPLFNDTTIEILRLLTSNISGWSISIDHFCDSAATSDGVNEQYEPDDITSGIASTQDVNLGECRTHEFTITIDGDANATIPVELYGMGLIYTPYDVVEE